MNTSCVFLLLVNCSCDYINDNEEIEASVFNDKQGLKTPVVLPTRILKDVYFAVWQAGDSAVLIKWSSDYLPFKI